MNLSFQEVLPHIFGFSGLFLTLLAWQFNKRRHILVTHASAALMFTFELYLLGGFVGSLMALMSATKALTAIYTQNRYVILGFIFVPLVPGFLMLQETYEILVLIAHVTGVLTFFSQRVIMMRILAPVGTVLWGVHNFIIGAWGQLLTDIFALVSMAIGAYRHHRGHNVPQVVAEIETNQPEDGK